ncbi:MAG: PIN domain-containing protein [Bacteroidetes bacterium]|nr:MAG: PIN domain-containing protein [Bacteroidota bacterium]
MIHSPQITCLLDTNVIVPIEVRDLLFWFAHDDLYIPRWSRHIFDEWVSVMRRRGISETEIKKRLRWANLAFPFAAVKDYEHLIQQLDLPDPKDRHVLAAAIKSKADFIITNNLKDFPQDYLASFEILAKSPDDFLSELITIHPKVAVRSFRKLVANRRNPNLNELQVIENLKRNRLIHTARTLLTHI